MKYIPKVGILALLIGVLFAGAAALAEPWNTILFLVVIPLVVQLMKLYFDKTGKTLGKVANQIISLVLTMLFTVLSGGFAGLKLPIFPAWGGDLVAFIGALTSYLGAWSVLIGAAWGSMMVLYEAIWDRLFVNVGLATADKLNS